MSKQRKIILGILLLIAAPLTFRAFSSLGWAIEDIFLTWKSLAPVGRMQEMVYSWRFFFPGVYWAIIAALAWLAFFAVKKRPEVDRQ